MKQVRRLRIRYLTLDGVDVRLHMSISRENIQISVQIEVKKEAREGKR